MKKQHNKEFDDWYLFSKQGDIEALSRIYNLYIHELISYGLKIHPVKDVVKDAIQEVFIHLIKKRKHLTVKTNVKSYIFSALRNQILEDLRTKARKTKIEQSLTDEFNHTDNDYEKSVISSEEKIILKEKTKSIIKHLPKHQKTAVSLKFKYNCDYTEISRIMGISIASARTLVYRSLKNIRQYHVAPENNQANPDIIQ